MSARQTYDDGLIQLDRHGDHVAPLPLSFGHIEGHRAGNDPRVQGRDAGAADAPVPHLGQLGPAPLAAARRASARSGRR